MIKKEQSSAKSVGRPRSLRVGFVPLTDCAPFAVARELGLFGKYGLKHVELSRELGWASIRDKIIHRELDAAHALAAMPVAATLGLGSLPCQCLTALVLNLHGNAITLSNDLWERGVRDGATLREEIKRVRNSKVFTFGVVFPFSSHRHLLRQWLFAHRIDPDRDVRIVVVPPPQMPANLKAGNLDGFCSGEPWNSVAVQSRAGWIAAVSSELDPLHPEKVLMVRHDFAVERAAEHVALVAALLEACGFCDQPQNRDQLLQILARREYVGAAEAALRCALSGELDLGQGNRASFTDFFVFNKENANEPSGEKAAWALNLVRTSGLTAQTAAINGALSRKLFRCDIFSQALALRQSIASKSEYEEQHQIVLA